MKFSCEKKILYDVISNVSLAVASKSTLTVLEGILLQCTGNTLSLTGFNLEMGIRKSIEVIGLENGEIVLNASLLANIISKMPDQEIDIYTDDRFLTVVRGGGAEFTVLGLSVQDYPEMPVVHSDKQITVDAQTLKSMIGQTLFAVAQTDQQPIYMGVFFELSDGVIHAVSVDGFRLAIRKESISLDHAQQLSFVVPGKTLHEIQKLLIKWTGDDQQDQQVTMNVSSKHIIFSCAGYSVISRLLEGDFIDYKTTIPQGSTTTVTISTKDFLSCLSRVSIIINDRVKSPVTCQFEDGIIKLCCETTTGKVQDSCPADIKGDPLTIAFNNKYMQDALKASESDQVNLELSGSLSPIKMTPIEEDEFLFLVLPVRV